MGIRTPQRFIWLIVIPLAVILVAPSAVTAQDSPATLKIAPTRYEGSVDPGKAKDGVVDVMNTGQQALTVTPSIQNIRMVGSNGDLEFYIGENPYNLNSFVQFDPTPFTLAPGEGRTFKFRISIQQGIYPGGYFGVLLFRTTPAEFSGNGVSQSGQVGTLLIMTVAGPVDQRGEINQLQVNRQLFTDSRTIGITYANTGNTNQRPLGVAYRPTGTMTIRNMLGLPVRRGELTGELVFPGAKREFSTTIKKPLWFGRYTAVVTLSPGEGQPAQTKRISWWAFSPLGMFVAALLLSAAVVAVVVWRRKRQRRGGRRAPQSTSLMHDAKQIDSDTAPQPPRDQSGPRSPAA